ncbi:potassium channel family protein [Mycolicibacterium grossiae]|uniref:Ion transporter n=1 Tax=Mycolicibacterium grossiae TaxID=1552759 RepID=A0A1E8Q397_9MYCO|nr:potassium channel family protein [Mycolicibacterium grossiae]OFJ52529.1 ion transporter [Mycolicibacterium grossiae]QEM47211.1 two pore domain potassium channel family protein [Mycolicibacterium grossiae]
MTAEPTRLARFERRTEWPLAAVAVLFLVLFSVDVLANPTGTLDSVLSAATAATYAVFVADYLARLYLAQPRGRWFIRHLLDLAIIALPALRPLRLLSLAVVIGALQRAIGHNIRGRVIVFTASGAAIIVYGASLAILQAERDHNDKIANFGDALWWSFTTVTTVGYGDTVPVTVAGRFVAVALMVAGVSLLGVVTATLASWIVERVAEEDTAGTAATAAQIDQLRSEIAELTETLRSNAGPAYGEADHSTGGRGDA